MVDKNTHDRPKSCWNFWLFGCGLPLVIIIVLVIWMVKGGITYLDSVGTEGSKKSANKNNDIKDFAPMSNAELADYFIAETTSYGNKSDLKLSKWDKDIRVKIDGVPDNETRLLIDNFINKFNSNSQTVKMIMVDADANYTIEVDKTTTSGLPGSAAFVSGDDCKIDAAVVTIGPEAGMVDSLPDYIVNHEMFHALGFGGHYRSKNTCTLMSAKHCGEIFTPNEDKLIQMLYNTDIPFCSTQTKIRDFFNSN